MTKREARKIATLRTAVILQQDDTLLQDETLSIDDAGKIVDEQKDIAATLAKRYDLKVEEIPPSTDQIVKGVLNGSL